MHPIRRLPDADPRIASILPALLIGALLTVSPSAAQTLWGNYAKNAQHTALSTTPSKSIDQVVWQTPVDLNPQYTGTVLYIHYGAPLVTVGNTIIVPVQV